MPDGPIFELNVSAYLPAEYVPSESERISLYKHLLSARPDELEKILETLVDRCGPLPEPGLRLFEIARLRLVAKAEGISEVHEEDGALRVYFAKGKKLSESTINRMMKLTSSGLTFLSGNPAGLRYSILEGEDSLQMLKKFFDTVFVR
jgi:transcription-repair coupling factor (superfamily II helicase)